MYLLSLSFTTHRQAAPVVWPGRLAVYGRNLEFTKSSREGHEIAVFIPYDNTCSQATTCISHFSLSFYNTHRQDALAYGQGVLSFCIDPAQVYQMSTKKRRQSLGGQGPRFLTFFRMSTRCLPTGLFYIERFCFYQFCSVFRDLRTPARGVTRPCQGGKVEIPRNFR